MALKREILLKLEDAELVQYFDNNQADFLALAKKMYDLVKDLYPDDTPIRPDDVADYILPALKSDEEFRHKLANDGLTQKYWYQHFTDLIIDRCWAEISAGEDE